MSHIKCPLCGKHSAISSFTPDEYDEEISIIQYQGLGRGKGFKSTVVGTIEDYPELSEQLLIGVSRIQTLLNSETPQNRDNREKNLREELKEAFDDIEQEQAKRKHLETMVKDYKQVLTETRSINRELEQKNGRQSDMVEELEEKCMLLEEDYNTLKEYTENILDQINGIFSDCVGDTVETTLENIQEYIIELEETVEEHEDRDD